MSTPSNRHRFRLALLGLCMGIAAHSGLVRADDDLPVDQGHPPPDKPGDGHHGPIDQALRACRSSLGGDDGTPVDPQKMDACMAAKGFKRPSGPPPDHAGPPPGESPSSSRSDA